MIPRSAFKIRGPEANMASCVVARSAPVVIGAAAAVSARSAARINRNRCSSDGTASSSICFTSSRGLKLLASRSLLADGKQWELRHSRDRMASQKNASPFWSSLHVSRGNSSPLLRAKRKLSGGGDVVRHGEEAEEALDADLQAGLNEISTEVLKAMLSEDDREVARVREKVDYLGEYLLQEKQLDAARFMLILRGMLDHEVVSQKDDLKGAYKKAFDTIASVVEDSGWVLKQEGADVAGVEMVDDELMPPVLNSQY